MKIRSLRKITALTLTAAIMLSASATAFAGTEVAEVEPNWNTAGLRLQGLIEEHGGCSETLAMLEDFRAENFAELTGSMPVATLNSGLVMQGEIMRMNLDFGILSYRTMNSREVAIVGLRPLHQSYIGIVEIPSRIGSHDVIRIDANAFSFQNAMNVTAVRFERAGAMWFGVNSFANSSITMIQAPLGMLQSYHGWLTADRAGVNFNRVRLVGTCRQNLGTTRCWHTGCRYRIGHVTGGNNGVVAVDDALQILRYLAGLDSAIRNANRQYNFDSLNASLILPATRDNSNVATRRPRENDAQDILRSLVGLCSWTNNTHCRTRPCAAGHCFS
jgi:hypothetical protein